MDTYISILRGINVAGQKKIKMVDLKALYEQLGFQNVVTYIQSGNVIFDSTLRDTHKLETLIGEAIGLKYGFQVPVQIRTNLALSKIIDDNPFQPVDLEQDGTKVLVTFLDAKPLVARIAELQNLVIPPEQLEVIGQEVHLKCPNGYGKTKLTNTFIERKLGVSATTRNWKSVLKLYELSQAQNPLSA